jgi:CBS domain containing-hemolysin-like protein
LAINYRPDKSRFEINRLAAHNHQYRVEARFLEIWPGLRNFLRLLALADAVALTIFAFAAWGASGGLLAFATILVAFLVARMFHKIAARLVARHLATLNKYFGWTKVLGELMVAGDDPQLASSHELLHLVEKADFLSPDQTSLMRAAAGLDQLIATDIMTPRDQIVFVRDRDVLGPKLLDELHQSGHEVFPVVRGNMEHVVGTLLLPDVLP